VKILLIIGAILAVSTLLALGVGQLFGGQFHK